MQKGLIGLHLGSLGPFFKNERVFDLTWRKLQPSIALFEATWEETSLTRFAKKAFSYGSTVFRRNRCGQDGGIPSNVTIHQLQVAFDATEDRLLFRLTTTAQEEFRVFLTRRFVRGLWPLLHKTIDSKVAVKAPQAESRREVIAFEHEKAVSATDFRTPFQEPAPETPRSFPLGQTPYVAAQGNVRLEGASFKLALNPVQGQGIEIGLDDRLMHSFCRLLEQAIRSADWDLPFLSGPNAHPPEAATAPVAANRMLN